MTNDPSRYVIGPDATIEDIDLDRDQHELYYQGEKLTEARAAELGDIAAKEARAARTAGLIPGGKSLSGGRTHSPVVQVRVSESTRQQLEAIAKARRMSVSKLSRMVLDEFVRTENEP